MAKNHEEVAKMMEELGCNAPHVSASGINDKIAEIDFKTVETCDTKFMYCFIKMDNGFVVTGKPAACISPENWRDEIGKKVSFDNSFSEIWRLEAYRKMSEQ